MRVFFIPWGDVNFYDHIWALRRHLGHMTYMLDSDWLKKFLLRSDWSGPIVTLITTIYTTTSQRLLTKRGPRYQKRMKMFRVFFREF